MQLGRSRPSSNKRPTYPFIYMSNVLRGNEGTKGMWLPDHLFPSEYSIIRSGEWFIFKSDSRHNEICVRKTSVFLSHLNFAVCVFFSWMYTLTSNANAWWLTIMLQHAKQNLHWEHKVTRIYFLFFLYCIQDVKWRYNCF